MTKPTNNTPPGPAQRQPAETTPAYEAFRTYLEQGTTRSTAAVARALGKSKTLMDRWSARHDWVRRVREFEAEATRTVDTAHIDAIARRSRRQAEIAQLHGEASAVVATEVLRRLTDPQKGAETLSKLDIDRLLQLEATLGRMHGRAVVAERLALGLTTDQPGEAVPLSTAEEIARRLTDDELDARLSGVDELAPRREAKRRGTDASSPGAADGTTS